MSMVVYADFSCPDCYLASRRVDALRAAGVEVDWRSIEHEPSMPVGGHRVSQAVRDGLSERFAELTRLLLPGEALPWAMPGSVAKTEAAVSAYAESYGAGVGDDVEMAARIVSGMAAGIKLRGGYALEKTPQPDASLAPFFPDAQRSVISAGFGRDWLDIGFQFISPASRTTRVNTDALNGTYTGNTYVLGISITKK